MANSEETRLKQTGEVFTPRSLIRGMLDSLPNSVWFDPNKRWLEPSAGDGNFLVEIKARLLQAGHDELHVLDHMLFSVELIDDNHWVLQHRLGYLVDGQPNPKFWPNGENFDIGQIHQIAQDLNGHNPYHERLGLERDEVLFHRNHVCTTALEYGMSFGRAEGEEPPVLSKLKIRKLGAWPKTDTPDIGEKYVVEQMLARQPQLVQQDEPKVEQAPKLKKPKSSAPKKIELSQPTSGVASAVPVSDIPVSPPDWLEKFKFERSTLYRHRDKTFKYCRGGQGVSQKLIEAYPDLQLITWHCNDFVTAPAELYVNNVKNTPTWQNRGSFSGEGIRAELVDHIRPLEYFR
jgi:hypothetical protein